MKQLIKKIDNLIDKIKISKSTLISLFAIITIIFSRNLNVLTIILYFIAYYFVITKIELLENKIIILEFEKRNMLLALSDEDTDLKEYLEKK